MKVGTKLNVAFYTMIAVFAIVIGVTFLSLNNIESKTEEALDVRVEQIRAVDQIRFALAMQGLYARAVVLDGTEESHSNFDYYKTMMSDAVVNLEKLAISDDMKEAVVQIQKHNKDFNNGSLDMLDALQRGDTTLANGFINTKLRAANSAVLVIAADIVKYQEEQLAQITKQTDEAIILTKSIAAIALAVSIVIGFIFIFYIRKTITTPLKNVVNKANIIAAGDLSQRDIVVKTKDEIGQLGEAFNSMKTNLSGLIKNIQVNTEQLSASAEELSASTEEITATTEDLTTRIGDTAENAHVSAQASNDSARAMDETASGVQRIAEATQHLHGNSMDASQTANNGSAIIQNAKVQMDIISTSTNSVNQLVQKLAQQTEEINNISKVITDITD